MREQLDFNLVRVRQAAAVRHKQIANYSLAAFIDEKRITENAAALNGSVAWKNLRVHVTQNHLRRSAVIPREQARPHPRLVIEQRTQIHGRKMSEVENLHGAPA